MPAATATREMLDGLDERGDGACPAGVEDARENLRLRLTERQQA